MTRSAHLLILLTATLALPGCQLVADIFRAGIWVGVIIVVGILLLVWFVAGRLRGR